MLYKFVLLISLLNILQPKIACSQDNNCLDENCNVYIKTKSNHIFYIGTYNRIEVVFEGIPIDYVKVLSNYNDVNIIRKDSNNFSLTATKPYKKINLIFQFGQEQIEKTFEIRRIPDPVAKLWVAPKKLINYGCGKAAGPGIIATLINFDYDARCRIHGYDLTRISKDGNRISAHNRGGRYMGKVMHIIATVQSGDILLYENIESKCPGDKSTRKINDIIRRIP